MNDNEISGWSIFKIGLIGILIITSLSIAGSMLGWFSEAATVAKQEFGPKASLRKYEWFKDTSAQIVKLDSDITIFELKLHAMCEQKLDRLGREQCMLWMQETAGIKSAYNDVVAEYNAASNKFNWSMYNTDNLPTLYKRK